MVASPASKLPREPIHQLTERLERYLHIEAASGVVLLAATMVALGVANSPWAEAWNEFWHTHVAFSFGNWKLDLSLQHWINDGLMVLFFFAIGLEVKYELVLGELRQFRQALLPIIAAVGGMVVPAGVYLALQYGQPGERGWGIPMATDIAFVVGCMALLGRRIPHGLRVLLLTLAIADDIGAILVIAVGYSSGLNWAALAWAATGIAVIRALAGLGVRSLRMYFFMGALVWLAFLYSGIHATLAGVILGLMAPARHYIGLQRFRDMLDAADDLLTGDDDDDRKPLVGQAQRLQHAARETVSPLDFLHAELHPWVSFVIMPIFALANAGVAFRPDDLLSGVAVATGLGLLIGKPVGIVLATWLAVVLRLAKLPEGVTWRSATGGSFLAGIGFTMALFIASLALQGQVLDQAKLGVLAGSVLSAVLGMGLLWTGPKPGVNTENQS